MAMKVLSQDEYDTFYTKYAGLADADNREKALNDLTDALERDLYLIGATAVEDKLQYQVPETIADLLRASTPFV
jgi:magnesium-transporting ATPase (P-type)